MQQFQVPQFIDIEDRIIGPLTLRQFLYCAGAAVVGVLGWVSLHPLLFAVTALPAAGSLVAMAFVKVNGRPLPTITRNAIAYYLRPRLYLWRKQPARQVRAAAPAPSAPSSPPAGVATGLGASKLSELAWSLDIKEKVGRN